MEFNGCYMHYDKASGRLLLGNECIEKTIHIKGAYLRTGGIRNRKSGKLWESRKNLWQRCPVLDEEEQPEVSVEAAVHEKHLGIHAHLETIVTLTGRRGTVWYHFIVFPEIPFVYNQTFLIQREQQAFVQEENNISECTGIERAEPQKTDLDVICGTDCLDCIPLGNSHLQLEIIRLYDKTDANDVLMERQTVSVYKRGKQAREGNIFRISDYPTGETLLLVKHSPTPSSALYRHTKDLVLVGNEYASLLGTGVDPLAISDEKIPYYASAFPGTILTLSTCRSI